MAFNYLTFKNFQGLALQANSFNLPDGSLEQATNCVITESGTIAKRRGFAQYAVPPTLSPMTSQATVYNLFLYKNTLLAALGGTSGGGTTVGALGSFSPSWSALTPYGTTVPGGVTAAPIPVTFTTLTPRSAQANSNLYVTSDNGILKLESATGTVYGAGVPTGLDLQGNLQGTTGILPADSQVGYRVVFIRRDANKNLLVSAPSEALVLTNSPTSSTATWTNSSAIITVTSASHGLTAGSQITVSFAVSGTATEEKALEGSPWTVTQTGLAGTSVSFTASGTTVAVSGLTGSTLVAGDIITVTSGTANVPGTWTVLASPAPTSTGFSFTVSSAPAASGTLSYNARDKFSYAASATPSGTSGTLSWGTPKTPFLDFTIPSEILTTEFSVQVYRSSHSVSSLTTPLGDYKLVSEQALTATQIAAGFVSFQDTIADLFLGAELYTNQNSQQGELQAATRAPYAKDVCFYKNQLLLANTTSRHRLQVYLGTTSSSIITSGAQVFLLQGNVVHTYTARSGVGNTKTTLSGSTQVSFSGSTVTLTFSSAHGFVSGDKMYVSSAQDSSGTAISQLTDQFITLSGGNITSSTVLTLTASGTPTGLYQVSVQGVTDAAGTSLFTLVGPTPSVSAGIQATAKALCKAINRDATSPVYARYTSGVSDVPGQMTFEAKGFGAAFYLAADSYTVASGVALASGTGAAFTPNLPQKLVSNTPQTVLSDNSVYPNAIYWSKLGEPEAFPLLNYILVGSKNYKILRIIPLRDSVIVVKEDGVFRVNGESISSALSVPLDTTVFCLAENSVTLLNNQVVALTNQGVVQITESAVSIISRKIETPIASVLGLSTLSQYTAAVSYESERLYILSTIAPNNTVPTQVYVYNMFTNAWTTWDTYFTAGIVGPNNTLFYVDYASGNLEQERKLHLKTDYAGQDYSVTVVSVSTDKLSAVLTIGGGLIVPQTGDVVVTSANVLHRIDTVSYTFPNATCTFSVPVTFAASDSTPRLYSRFRSTIKLAPVTAGDVGRSKHFAEMQLTFRNNGCNRATVYYTNEKFGGSESIAWVNQALSGGWGTVPFGLFKWGQVEGIQLPVDTESGTPARVYVSRSVARSTFLQPVIEHNEACEQINLQSVALAVRGYGERTNK